MPPRPLAGPRCLPIKPRLLPATPLGPRRYSRPPALLPSQFAILEPLQPDENGVEVSIEGSVEEMVERAVAAVNEYAAKVASQSQQAE